MNALLSLQTFIPVSKMHESLVSVGGNQRAGQIHLSGTEQGPKGKVMRGRHSVETEVQSSGLKTGTHQQL